MSIADYLKQDRLDRIRDTHVLISNATSSLNAALLFYHKVTHVISAVKQALPRVKGICYLHIPIEDDPNTDIAAYFAQTNQFIEACRSAGGTVLVHCEQGISRSVTIAIAYVMHSKQCDDITAFRIVDAARPIAAPNKGFRGHLRQYAKLVVQQQQQQQQVLQQDVKQPSQLVVIEPDLQNQPMQAVQTVVAECKDDMEPDMQGDITKQFDNDNQEPDLQ